MPTVVRTDTKVLERTFRLHGIEAYVHALRRVSAPRRRQFANQSHVSLQAKGDCKTLIKIIAQHSRQTS